MVLDSDRTLPGQKVQTNVCQRQKISEQVDGATEGTRYEGASDTATNLVTMKARQKASTTAGYRTAYRWNQRRVRRYQ
jgi:hypothetical protein